MTKFRLTKIFWVLAALFLLNAAKKNEPIWLTDFEETLNLAKERQKPILMVFSGSDWCKPCKKLKKEVFDTEVFKEFASRTFVLLQVDFPRKRKNKLTELLAKHNEILAERYNKDGDFPLVVLLSAEKEVLDSTGYRRGGAKKYVQHLQSLLEKPKSKSE